MSADSELHQDKGQQILSDYDGDKEWTPEEEKKLRRKIDWKLMPILCFTYGLQYYDKAMLGQAVRKPSPRTRRLAWSRRQHPLARC